MKVIAHLYGLEQWRVGSDLLRQLLEVSPNAMVDDEFVLTLPLEDPRVQMAIAVLEREGWSAWNKRSYAASKEYVLDLTRHYESAELAQCDYLELVTVDYLLEKDIFGREMLFTGDGASREKTISTGRIQLEARFLRRDIDFAHMNVIGQWVVVPDRVRKLLEQARLRHVVFAPTVLTKKVGKKRVPQPWAKAPTGPWWELLSDVTLPPVSDSMDIRDPATGERVKPGTILMCNRVDGHFAHPELHYRAADLAKMDPFDLAHTRECFRGAGVQFPEDRPLVASRRFYELCVKHGLKLDWAPVRLD